MLTLTTEQENIEMYREYGIAEWREKSIILGEYAEVVKRCLELGQGNTLVTLTKLPFPEFATSFFNSYVVADKYTCDPAFGYKLYMLSYNELENFRRGILYEASGKQDKTVKPDTNSDVSYAKIKQKLQMPLEALAKTNTIDDRLKEADFKFLYISQYIDTSVAQQLNMSIVPLLESDEDIDGYNIEGKLALLNPVARTVIAKTLGMYGHDRESVSQLVELLKINSGLVSYFIKSLMPLMKRPTGEMRSKLKVIGSEDGSKIEYGNREYRTQDIKAECLHYLNSCVTPAEQIILSSLPNNKMKLYIVSKYFGWTEEQVCRNMVVIPDDIARAHKLVQKNEIEQ